MKTELTWLWAAGLMLAGGIASAETYYLDGSQQIDGEAPVSIAFTNSLGAGFNVNRTGDGSSGDPWTFSFSVLPDVALVDLGPHMLYCEDSPSDPRTFVFDFAGTNAVGTAGTGIRTYKGTEKRHGDHVKIFNFNDIAIGGINTRQTRTSGGTAARNAGDVVVGETVPAGSIRVAFVHTQADNNAGNAGHFTVLGNGDVLISDGEASGDILTYTDSSGEDRVGDVTVVHAGDFLARNIKVWTRCSSGNDTGSPHLKRSGRIVLDGGSAGGDAVVEGDIQTMHPSTSRNSQQSFIVIRNYDNVLIKGDVLAQYDVDRFNNTRSTDLTITNITGNIDLQGQVNLWASAVAGNDGQMRLACDGVITLASLDLSKVDYAALSSGSGRSVIEGELLNFNANVER